jgi:hypothetical protein
MLSVGRFLSPFSYEVRSHHPRTQVRSFHREDPCLRNRADIVAQTVGSFVDDGSTDKTAEIIESYTKRYPWIELVGRREQSRRSFADKVHALMLG